MGCVADYEQNATPQTVWLTTNKTPLRRLRGGLRTRRHSTGYVADYEQDATPLVAWLITNELNTNEEASVIDLSI